MGWWRRTLLFSAVALGLAAPPAEAAPYYEGKTITILVGQQAGGTVDLFIRTFAEFWKKYIPGHPEMVINNMPGGGTLRVVNYLHEVSKPDGLTIVYGPWQPTAQLLKLPEFRGDYTK